MDGPIKLVTGAIRLSSPNQSNILNLSLTFNLSEAQTSLLEKGLLFIPTVSHLDKQLLRRDLHNYHRRLKILEHFNYALDFPHEPFTSPSTWEPEEEYASDPLKKLLRDDREAWSVLSVRGSHPSNLSKGEREALGVLKQNRDVIIKPADKGSKIVIMDKTSYLVEANRQLENKKHYLPLGGPIHLETQEKVRKILGNLVEKRKITKKQYTYLYGKDPPRRRKFYLLPKIHKDPVQWTVPNKIPPGRPIVSDCGSESCRVAEYLDAFLNPLSQKHPSFVKDTYSFVALLKNIELDPGSFFFTVDVDALYTNIDTSLGLQAIRETFKRYPHPGRPEDEILQLLELGLTCNDFEFNGKHYLQVHGTAMGKKFAPAYANIYMAEWERTVGPKCGKVPTVYLRYLDDIFGIWPHSEEEFREYMGILNSHHKTIKLKYEMNRERITFLDTEVFARRKPEGGIGVGTRVFFKPTDTHALLHGSSYHPKHTFRGIIKSQLIRFHRICTEKADVQLATKVLFRALEPRGYGRSFLRKIKTEVYRLFSDAHVRTQETGEKSLIPFVSTYSLPAKILCSSVRVHFQQLQQSREEIGNFSVVSAFRRNRNLKDLLVKAAVERPRRDRFASFFNNTKYIVNSFTHLGAPVWGTFSPDSQNLVYAIECRTCGRLYIGQTKNSLRTRLKQHIYWTKNPNKATVLYTHLRLHGLENMRIMGLQQGSNWTHKQRLWTEGIWIKKLGTISPNGLNELP